MDGDMDFAIICPTSGLERYARLSRVHLVLAHEFGRLGGGPKHHEYRTFYINRKVAGDFIILDNGAYESAGIPDTDLVERIRDLQPDVCVLPDYPLTDWHRTWHASIYFLDAWSDRFPNVQWCYIPQAERGDLHGFLESYQEAANDHRIGWIGIPRALAYAITDNPLMRVEFARMVRKDYPHLKLHAFGMVNGDVHELPYLDRAGVNSVDSSAPVWRGWHNNYIDWEPDRKKWDECGSPVDFSAGLNGDVNGYIQHNLEACGVRIPAR
jgi:hypothetical protein